MTSRVTLEALKGKIQAIPEPVYFRPRQLPKQFMSLRGGLWEDDQTTKETTELEMVLLRDIDFTP